MAGNIPTLIQKVESLLPQTQCERCGHPGCRPYAESVVRDKASVALCFPGGQKTADAIAHLLNRKPETVQDVPGPKLVASVVEKDCIGCTKCIQSCPVDAIVGAPKLMHTVIESECTGCELCIPACPMDCIELAPTQPATPSWIVGESPIHQAQAQHAKDRFIARKERLAQQKKSKAKTRQVKTNINIQAEIFDCIQRAKQKRKNHEPSKTTGNI